MRLAVDGQSYAADVSFSEEDGLWVGRVWQGSDLLVFEGDSTASLEASLAAAVQAWRAAHPVDAGPAVIVPQALAQPAGTLSRLLCERSPVARNRTLLGWLAFTYGVLVVLHACLQFNADGQLVMTPLPENQPVFSVVQELCLLFYLALLLWRYLSRVVEEVTPEFIMRAAMVLGFLAWLCPVGNSADVYAYLQHGRILSHYHRSPYYHTYGTAQEDNPATYGSIQDSYAPYAWSKEKMVYGPVNVPFFFLAAGVTDVHPPDWLERFLGGVPKVRDWVHHFPVLAAVYVLKGFWLALHLAGVRLLLRALPDHPVYRQRLLLYAVNPHLLFECITNGHHDALIVFFTVACLYAVRWQRWGHAALAAVASVLTKVSGLGLIIGLLVYGIRRRHAALVAMVAMACGAGLLFLRGMVFHSMADAAVLWPYSHGTVYTPQNNMSAALYAFAPPAPEAWKNDLIQIYWHAFRPALALLCVLWLWQERTFLRLVTGQLLATAALLAFLSAYIRPWYWTWLLPFGLFASAVGFEYTLLMSFSGLFVGYYGDDPTMVMVMALTGAALVAFALRPERPAWQLRLALGLVLVEVLLAVGWAGGVLPPDVAYYGGGHAVPFAWLVAGTWPLWRPSPRRHA